MLFRASKGLLNVSRDDGLPPNLHAPWPTFVNDLGQYFVTKIETIQLKLDIESFDSVTSLLDSVPVDSPSVSVPLFTDFENLSTSDVASLIRRSALKSCPLDPIPSRDWKEALVYPVLKKPGLDAVNKNLRLVSNLAFVSKLTEKAAFDGTSSHMSANGLYPIAQSAYRPNHSTDTALLKVKNDNLLNMNKQHVTLLVLLDLSASFDTVDHVILLRTLGSLGIGGTVIEGYRSYLSGRGQRIPVRGCTSERFNPDCGVPQGSCLGPLLLSIYTSSLLSIVQDLLPTVPCYADDNQLYVSFSPADENGQSDAIAAMEIIWIYQQS
ncbi:putative RNA-directed DNA polymerase from transposon X-element [Stylophora pistillata]|uniref:Putative RNA-directed DNA polymerase from transposon X-element n=1 Tax=Stylophora pistillata TaxID=50429 RepID=A0A2B4SI19_STYPI|nr:putative RNA-directed DNA polymerase from transposon X-element [Stylophora pistillata]